MRLVFSLLCLTLGGCGPIDPPGFDPAFAKVQPLIAANCGTCHNGSYQAAFPDAKTFHTDVVREHIESGEMPPAPLKLSAADKAALLDYLK